MLPELDDCSWSSAFHEAIAGGDGRDGPHLVECTVERAEPNDNVGVQGFCRESVSEIFGIVEGENDEDDWVVCGRLRDGRYFALAAGCDYTGWD